MTKRNSSLRAVGSRNPQTATLTVSEAPSELLRELVAHPRSGGNRFENSDPRFFLLPFDFSQTGSGRAGLLLAEDEITLRGGQIGSGGFENLPVRFAFRLEGSQAMTSLG